jgi:adenylate cyclase
MSPFRKFIRKPFVFIPVASLLVLLFTVWLQKRGGLELLELSAYDWFIRMEPKLSRQDPRITIIEILEKDIQAIGRWPLADGTVAAALKILLKGRPRAIGIDIYRDILVPPGSEELIGLFVNNPNVIGAMTMGEKGIAPLAAIKDTEQAAFVDIVVDPGGIVRRGLLFMDDGQTSYNSFAMKLASLYLEAEGLTLRPDPANPQYVRLKETTIPPLGENDGGYVKADVRGYQFLLDFKDADRSFQFYAFSDLLSGKVPVEAITNKIIVVGVKSESVKDFFFTPLSRGLGERQQIPGCVVHGHIASQLLRFALDNVPPMRTPGEKQKLIWLFTWSFLGSVMGFYIRSARRLSVLMTGGLLVLFSASYFAFLARWWIPVVPPSLSFFMSAACVMAYMTGLEKRERAMLMNIFSKYVSKEVAEMIWQQRDQFLDNGRPRSQEMTVTVLFSDLRNFTTISEKMAPQDLIDWLNTYMEAMACVIMAHGGVVDSYSGDGIKADFGVPLPRKNEDEVRADVVNAVTCALSMEKEMNHLNTLWREKGLPLMTMRVGIFTGPVVAGLLGSTKRFKYTTIGDTVNIASRLESYDKEIAKDTLCRILIGESTLRYLDNRFKTERIGEAVLKGRDARILIYQVLGEATLNYHTTSQEVLR